MSNTSERGEETLAQVAADAVWVRRLAVALAGDVHSDEDISQEALLAAAERGMHRPANLRSWLTGVVRNLTRLRRRSEIRRSVREESVARPEQTEDPTLALERLEIQEALSHAVREPEEPYRSTVLLRWYEGLEPREIARRTGVNVRTVHTRVSRALDLLRLELDRRSHGDRSRWLSVWIPLVPKLSTKPLMVAMTLKAKLALTTIAVVACASVVLYSISGEKSESWDNDQFGNRIHNTLINYPRSWGLGARQPKEAYREFRLSDHSYVKYGPAIRWSRNGTKIEEGNYRQGKRDGPWIFRNEDGSIDAARSGAYQDDVRIGPSTAGDARMLRSIGYTEEK